MTIRLESKRPDEVRDYLHDWEPFLGADTITGTPTWTAVGVTLGTGAQAPAVQAGARSVKFWVSAGVDGVTARITHSIVTVGGRTESEIFILPICAAEQVGLAEVKTYLRVLHTDEDTKIAAMIPRARKWVEDYTGLALRRREFVERHTPKWGAIRLNKGPLVAATDADVEITYLEGAVVTPYVGRAFAPSSVIFPATAGSWPSLTDDQFTITYTAGFDVGEADDRLIGAMLALIEGEFAEGFAYPERATDAAERCCGYLRTMVA